jgi:pimeloyl-ACP methyl ester carboxylesterase
MQESVDFKSGYSEVNGLSMYYEIYGTGKPLVLIHGGGSNIQTTFGNIIPKLAKHRQIIAMDLQAHGRTNDRNADLSFEQDADDVATLSKNLDITKADFLGFSNGGQTTIELALRHPESINKIIIASAFYKLNAVVPQFWDGFNHATLNDMPQVLREAYLKVTNNDEAGLLNMFNRDVQRMKTFKGWTDEQMKLIKAPALVINGSHDISTPEHAVEMYRVIPDSELAIFPGGHGAYLGAIETLENENWSSFNAIHLIEEFLDK